MRPQPAVLAALRSAPELAGVEVVSALPDADHRQLPMIAIRRAGGTRNPNAPWLHARPEVELTAVSAGGPVEAEELYETALEALWASVGRQDTHPNGSHLQSFTEARGATQTASPYPDTWSVTGSLRVNLRKRA